MVHTRPYPYRFELFEFVWVFIISGEYYYPVQQGIGMRRDGKGGEDRGTLMCMIHTPVPHVPSVHYSTNYSTIPHARHYIDQDIIA